MKNKIDDLRNHLFAALEALEAAGERKADAVARCQTMEDERPIVKACCIAALVGTENPTNGKLHSASSAEAVVESHPDYAAYRLRQRQAEVDRILAATAYDAAKLRATLAVGLAVELPA